MRKVILAIIFCGFFLSGCSMKYDLINVNSKQVNSLLEGNDQVVYLYVGRPTCPQCEEFQPIIEEAIQQTKSKVHYYNTDDARAEDETQLTKIAEKLEIIGVPAIFKIEDGEIVNQIIGVADMEATIVFLTN